MFYVLCSISFKSFIFFFYADSCLPNAFAHFEKQGHYEFLKKWIKMSVDVSLIFMTPILLSNKSTAACTDKDNIFSLSACERSSFHWQILKKILFVSPCV